MARKFNVGDEVVVTNNVRSSRFVGRTGHVVGINEYGSWDGGSAHSFRVHFSENEGARNFAASELAPGPSMLAFRVDAWVDGEFQADREPPEYPYTNVTTALRQAAGLLDDIGYPAVRIVRSDGKVIGEIDTRS